jgi:hypothetical protein
MVNILIVISARQELIHTMESLNNVVIRFEGKDTTQQIRTIANLLISDHTFKPNNLVLEGKNMINYPSLLENVTFQCELQAQRNFGRCCILGRVLEWSTVNKKTQKKLYPG